MPLITRIGARYANSFVTLHQADLIMPTVTSDSMDAWTALSDADKEYRLAYAATLIGYLPLRGKKTYKNQALAFPRVLWDRDNGVWTDALEYEVDFHSAFRIPEEVKEAQCMVAYSVVHRALANRPSITEVAGMAVSSVGLGGMLNVTFGDMSLSGTPLDKILSSAQSLIYVKLKRWLSQFRGWAAPKVSDEDYYSPITNLTSTTTTTSSTSTTTSSSSSTTTTTAP